MGYRLSGLVMDKATETLTEAPECTFSAARHGSDPSEEPRRMLRSQKVEAAAGKSDSVP